MWCDAVWWAAAQVGADAKERSTEYCYLHYRRQMQHQHSSLDRGMRGVVNLNSRQTLPLLQPLMQF